MRLHPQRLGVRCEAPQDEWRVATRNAHHSAFAGYQWTWSQYSLCHCLRCGWYWRTKAAYVTALRDETQDG